MFPLDAVKFRSIRSQMFFKIGVLKKFAIFTGKHLCCCLFLIKLQACNLQLCYKEAVLQVFPYEYWWLLLNNLFETCWNFTLKNKKMLLLSCSGFFIDNLKYNQINISTNDNDQVKAVGKDYMNVKPLWPVCVCVATMLQKTKSTKFAWEIFVFF